MVRSPEQPVPFDKALRLRKGLFVHSYRELASRLLEISADEFSRLTDQGTNGPASWVAEQYGDEELASSLRKARSRAEAAKAVRSRLRAVGRERRPRTHMVPAVFLAALLLVVVFIQQLAVSHFVERQQARMAEAEQNILDQRIRLAMQENTIHELQQSNDDLEGALYLQEEACRTQQNVSAPQDRIPPRRIRASSQSVCIDVTRPRLAIFTDTGSMLPVFDVGHTGIESGVSSPAEIKPGDIISYRYGDETIAHRVRETGSDGEGWYAIVQGDNNPAADEHKVRFPEITGVLVAIVY